MSWFTKMAFQDSYSKPDIGRVNAMRHYKAPSAEILRAEKIRAFLGLGLYSPIHKYQVQVWARVVWVHVPGLRPRFVSFSAIK